MQVAMDEAMGGFPTFMIWKVAARRGGDFDSNISVLDCPNDGTRPIENNGEIPDLSNPVLQQGNGWQSIGTIADRHARRMALCVAIVRCDPRDAFLILERSLQDMMKGAPIPALMSVMGEARDWARFATRSELKAYCVATFEAMNTKDRAAFLRHVKTLEAAA